MIETTVDPSAITTDAGLIPPAVTLLSAESVISGLAEFLPETFSESDLTQFADSLTGAVTFADGVITTDLTSIGGSFAAEIDLVAEIDSLIDDLTGITASVGIEDGFVTTDLTLESGEPLMEILDLNQLTEAALLPLFNEIEGSFAINQGIIDVDVETGIGDFTGTLSLLDGALSADLTTPFGDLEDSFAFDEEATFAVPFGESVVTFDLFEGTATIDNPDTAAPTVLTIADFPIGITLDEGLAAIEIGGFSIGDPFDFTEVLSSLITPLVAGTDGAFILSEGVLEGFLDFELGEVSEAPEVPEAPIDPTLPVDPALPETPEEPALDEDADVSFVVDFTQLLSEASAFTAGLNGTLTFDGGVVMSDVTSEAVDLTGDFDLLQLAEDVTAVADFLGLVEEEAEAAAGDTGLEALSTEIAAFNTLGTFLPETFTEADLTQFADSVAGTITFADGVIVTDLTTGEGVLAEETDVVAELGRFIEEITGITASIGVEAGVATLDGVTGDGDVLSGGVDLNSVVLSFLSDAEGTVVIENGMIETELDTPVGEFEAELSFVDGELVVELETPLFEFESTLAFDDAAEFTILAGESSAVVNLFESTVTLNADSESPTELSFADIPITFTVEDSIVTGAIAGLPIEPIDLDGILTSLVTPILTGTNGAFILSEGVLAGGLDIGLLAEDGAPVGPIDPTLPVAEGDVSVFIDFNQLLTDVSNFLASLTGTLTFGGGTVVSTVVIEPPVVVDPVTGVPVLDPVTGEPVTEDLLVDPDAIDLTGEFDLIALAEDVAEAALFLDMLGLADIDEPATEDSEAEDPEDPDLGAEDPVMETPDEAPALDEPETEGTEDVLTTSIFGSLLTAAFG
ncbi:MAG: hypothetical protein ACFB4J_07605 [Elainellaceae cyanobacterium]